MEQMRIVKEMRESSKQKLIEEFGEDYDKSKVSPKYMVWENVCLIFDTLVETSKGLKKIGEIRPGELVLTHNNRYMPVIKTYVHANKEVIQLNLLNEKTIVCTPNHPFYCCKKIAEDTYGELEFVPAGMLNKDYRLACFLDGELAYTYLNPENPITILDHKETVYNISVLEDNTYVANGIICHNCGAFSSGDPAGSDFAAVLEEITRVVVNEPPTVSVPEQGWPYSGCIEGVGDEGVPFSICWRTHDAQYWGKTVIDNSGRVVKPGTPQRRRRIALVADFGGQSAPEILFECEGSTGNSKQSKEERQVITETSTGCSGKSGKDGTTEFQSGFGRVTVSDNQPRVFENHGQDTRYTELRDVCTTISATYGMGGNNTPFVVDSHPADSRVELKEDGVVQTLTGRMGTGGGNTPMVMESRRTIAIEGNGSRESHKGDGYAESDVMYTLNTVEQHAVCVSEPVAVESHPQDSRVKINPNDVNQTLSSNMEHDPANGGLVLQKTAEQHGVCYGFQGQTGASTDMPIVEEGTPTMVANQVTNVMISSEPILLESNQNHATVQTDGVSTTLPASMGEGGGYVPMVVDDQKTGVKQEGCDVYNGDITGDVSPTLSTKTGLPSGSGGKVLMSNTSVYATELGAASRLGGHVTEEVAPTLRASMGDNQTAVVYGMSSYDSNAMKSDNPESGIYEADTARTLDLNGGNPACNQGGMMVVQSSSDKSLKESVETYATSGIPSEGCLNPWDVQSKHIQPEDGVAESLYAGECRYGGGESYVMQNPPVQSMELFHCTSEEDKVQTLKARDYKDPQVVCVDMGGSKSQCGVTGEPVVHQATPIQTTSIVRRLTPLECERLQGFPDNWTDIGEWVDERGKKHKPADAPRYKALGNSIALPFWDWMADRMCRKLWESGRTDLTMGSLFDGISGFPLVYSRHGCKPSWTSEIEQFPIAVCKKHFGDEATGEVGDLEQWLKPSTDFTQQMTEGGGNDRIVGSSCASDYKGVRNQDIEQGKYVIEDLTYGKHDNINGLGANNT